MAYSHDPQPPAQDCVCWEMLAYRTLAPLSPRVRAPEDQTAEDEDARHLVLTLGPQNLLLSLEVREAPQTSSFPTYKGSPQAAARSPPSLFALASHHSRPVLASQQKCTWRPCRQAEVEDGCGMWMPGLFAEEQRKQGAGEVSV